MLDNAEAWLPFPEPLCGFQAGPYNRNMKLRIQGNSIRFRVTQSEMAALAAGAKLEESTQFGPAPSENLTYAIEISSQCSDIRASYSKGKVEVAIPADLARTWASTSQVGIEHSQPIARGEVLKIILEKDFHCLHSKLGEDERDNFPNPGDPSGGQE
jgi:hypothetical protein